MSGQKISEQKAFAGNAFVSRKACLPHYLLVAR